MPIRYFFKQLLLPPGGLLLLLLAGWWLRRRAPRLAGFCFILGFAGLWLSSLPVAVEWLARAIEKEQPLAESEWATLGQRAEAIVVLGAGRQQHDPAWGEDQPGLLAVERVRYAARLAKASGLPLLTSGGLHFGQPPSEAALMADTLARDLGTPVRWREARSLTTWENARYSAELLRAQGVRRVVLVTQAWHMPRARWCFEEVGFEVVPAPVGALGIPNGRPFGGWLPENKALWQSSMLVNEVIGLLAYPLAYGK